MEYLNLDKIVSFETKEILDSLKKLKKTLKIEKAFDVSYNNIDTFF